jgi:hypothetical protein
MLPNLVYIVGKRGSGKTTLLNALLLREQERDRPILSFDKDVTMENIHEASLTAPDDAIIVLEEWMHIVFGDKLHKWVKREKRRHPKRTLIVEMQQPFDMEPFDGCHIYFVNTAVSRSTKDLVFMQDVVHDISDRYDGEKDMCLHLGSGSGSCIRSLGLGLGLGSSAGVGVIKKHKGSKRKRTWEEKEREEEEAPCVKRTRQTTTAV